MRITQPAKFNTIINEDITIISSSLDLSGISIGSICLEDGAVLTLHGIHSGSIFVGESFTANIYGTVNGVVNNHGTTHIYKNANVNNKTYLSDETL